MAGTSSAPGKGRDHDRRPVHLPGHLRLAGRGRTARAGPRPGHRAPRARLASAGPGRHGAVRPGHRGRPRPLRGRHRLHRRTASREVAVVATGDSARSAFWGELFSAAAIGRGAAGIVTDGCLRDSPKIAALGFPAFARGRRPLDYRARMRVVARAQPVVLGGVTIRPGELVMADDDGVAVVPASVEEQVLARARARVETESTVLEELLAGDGLRTVWERHGVL
ncbi:RraA family protein [Actinomadura sp. J1-007]|uniref:RraA family protein n=1 Tax=Actinomadura sp. J1-007 TaxID=2661913 RepID=UPI0019D65596|nr:hypothetical protein [Actinomadura sp. J1-007]